MNPIDMMFVIFRINSYQSIFFLFFLLNVSLSILLKHRNLWVHHWIVRHRRRLKFLVSVLNWWHFIQCIKRKESSELKKRWYYAHSHSSSVVTFISVWLFRQLSNSLHGFDLWMFFFQSLYVESLPLFIDSLHGYSGWVSRITWCLSV